MDAINLASEELLYVAMSRAKSLLVVVGTPATCAAIRGRRLSPAGSVRSASAMLGQSAVT
jgi:hypothetical protein